MTSPKINRTFLRSDLFAESEKSDVILAEKRFTRWANITRNTDSDETFLGLEVAGTNKNKRSARLNVFLDSLTSKNYGFMASKIADLA